MGFLDQMAKAAALGMAVEMSKNKKGKPDPYKAAGIAAGMGYTALSDRASLGAMLGSEGAFDDVPPDDGYEDELAYGCLLYTSCRGLTMDWDRLGPTMSLWLTLKKFSTSRWMSSTVKLRDMPPVK